MTIFDSSVKIHQPVNKIYSFLADMNNHQHLMPDDVQNWTSTYDTAAFNIKGMFQISLAVEKRIDNLEIVIIPADKPPFNLQLKWNLIIDEDYTDVVYTITADLNMVTKMFASKPLQELASFETQALAGYFK